MRYFVVVVAMIVAACDVVPATNPFDPSAPDNVQRRAQVRGRVIINDPSALHTTRQRVLETMSVAVIGEDGRRGDPITIVVDTDQLDANNTGGTFAFADDSNTSLRAGSYTLSITGAPDNHRAPAFPSLSLVPGDDVDVGALVFTAQQGGENTGDGAISGTVRSEGTASVPLRVTLFEKRNDGTVRARESIVTSSTFSFASLGFGLYAVTVEGEGQTPVYRLGLEIAPEGASQGQPQFQFNGDQALVTHPLTSALAPAVGDPTVILDEGTVYVRGNAAPVLVLPFASQVDVALGITGVRLSTSPNFTDADGSALPFAVHQASTSIPLPGADGITQLFAQFEARSTDGAFSFVSPTATLTIVKDTTPPSVIDVRALNTSTAADVVMSAARTLTLSVDSVDVTSGVDAVSVAFDIENDTFDDVTGQPGLVRLQRQLTSDSDGARDVIVVVEDRAGNRSAPYVLPVAIDTAAPAISLTVQNATSGVLRERAAQLEVTNTTAGDDDYVIAVGIQGSLTGAALLPLGAHTVVLSPSLEDGASVTFEVRATDATSNTTIVTQTVSLQLRGNVVGALISDGAPSVLPSVAGAAVTLTNSRGATVSTSTVGADGAFAFVDVPEGRNHTLRATLDGHAPFTRHAITVDANDDTNLGDELVLSLLRGEVRGVAKRGDKAGDGAAHGGIGVTLRLTSNVGRTFSRTATTDLDGSYAFQDVPRTLVGESIAVTAGADGYGSASTSMELGAAVQAAGDLLLPLQSGDFDVCRTSEPGAGCTPVRFFNGTTVDVRLRDVTDVVALRVSVDGAAAVSLPLAANNRTTVDISGVSADKVFTITLQAEKAGGALGAELSQSIVRDTAPPSAVAIARLQNSSARDQRFTREEFTRVEVSANAGIGAGVNVASLAAARVIVTTDDDPPALPASTDPSVTLCAAASACQVTLPPTEALFHIYAFACDEANNCAAPVRTLVIRDVTPPSTANGADFSITAAGSVTEAGVVVLPTPFYEGVVKTGLARSGGGVVVVDEDGAQVADVWGYRFALSAANVRVATIQSFNPPPEANDPGRTGADIVVPALPTGDVERTIFAELIDAAGNLLATAIEVRVVIDTVGPAAALTLNGGAPTTSTLVPFNITVPVGAEAPRRVEFSINGGDAQSFPLPLAVDARLLLPDTDGVHSIAMAAIDRVGNRTMTTHLLLLDRGAPRIDAARCVSPSCTDTGTGELVSNGVPPQIDLVVTTFDVLSDVPEIRIGAAVDAPRRPVIAGQIHGVPIAENTTSTLELFPIDALGNIGAALPRAVRHDSSPPIVSLSLESSLGAAPGDVGASVFTRARAVLATVEADATAFALVPGNVVASCASQAFVPVTFPTVQGIVVGAGDGDKDVTACARDAAGNVAGVVRAIRLDQQPPQVVQTINGGASRTASSLVNVVQSVTPSADLLRKVESTNANFDCAAATFTGGFAAINAAPRQVSLAAGDGTRSFVTCFQDQAGSVTRVASTIEVDNEPPSAVLTLDNGAAFTLDVTVTLRLQNRSNDIASIATSLSPIASCASAGGYLPFTGSETIDLNGDDGQKAVFVCLQDFAGNFSDVLEDSIFLDRNAPEVALAIESAASSSSLGFTSTRDLSVRLNGISADVTAFAIGSSTLNCATAPYIGFGVTPAPSTFDTTFRLPAETDGTKTVRVCVKDVANRTGSDEKTIELDTTPPTVNITAPEVSTSSTFAIDLQSIPAGDLLKLFASENANENCAQAAYQGTFADLPSSTLFSLTQNLTTTSNRDISLCFRDQAGNFARINARVFFDPNPPVLQAADCLDCADFGGKSFTNKDLVGLAVNVAPGTTDIDFVLAVLTSDLTAPFAEDRACTTDTQCRLSAGEVCDDVPVDALSPPTQAKRCVQPLPPGFSFDVTLARATLPVTGINNEGAQGVLVALRDEAGNFSAPRTFTVVRDVTPPVVAFELNVGSLTNLTTVQAQSLSVTEVDHGVGTRGTFDLAATVTFADAVTRSLPISFGPGDAFDVPLTGGDGAKAVFLRARDHAGNVSVAAQRSTTLDATRPTTPRFAASAATLTTTTFSLSKLALASGDSGSGLSTPPYRLDYPNNPCDAPLTIVDGACRWDGDTTVTLPLIVEGENLLTVRAVDNAGNLSDPDALTVTRDTIPPAVPINVKAIGRDGQVVVSWSPSTSPDVAGYRVFYGTTSSSSKIVLDGDSIAGKRSPVDVGNVTSATFNVPNDDVQFVAVEAYDAVRHGQVSANCEPSTTNGHNCSALSTTIPMLAQLVHLDRVGFLDSNFSSIAVQGSRAYALHTGGGFTIIDISDPASPSIMGTLNAVQVPEDDRVIVHGTTAFAMDRNTVGLHVIDVGNPLAPTSVGLTLTRTTSGITVSHRVIDAAFHNDTFLYVAHTAATGNTAEIGYARHLPGATNVRDQLLVRDRSTLNIGTRVATSIDLEGLFLMVGLARGNEASGGLARATLNAGITGIDSSADPLTPNSLTVSTSFANSDVRQVKLYRNRSFVATTDTLFLSNLVLNQHHASTATSCQSLALSPGLLFCANASAGDDTLLSVYDIRSESEQVLVGRVLRATPGEAIFDLAVADNAVFGRTNGGDLVAFEIARPLGGDALVNVVDVAVPSSSVDSAMMGRTVVSATNSPAQLTINDSTTLTFASPTPVEMDPSSTSTTEVISTLGAAEGWVVAGYSNHEEPALIRSRDINANNKLLNVRGSGDLGAWVSLIIRGSTIFGIRESRGRIVPFTGSGEITDGTSAVFSTSTAKTKAMVAQDGMLYAVSDTGELRIIDARVVTGTSSLTKLPQLLNGVPNDALAIDGPFLYAASASGGVRIINISEAANGTTSYINPTPFFEDTALIGGRTTIANAGRLALTTTSSNTLEIVDPNPTNISVLFTKTPFFPTKRIFNLGSIVFTSGSSANFRVLELRR